MEIVRNGTQASVKGNADWFTGSVRIDPLFSKKESTKGAGALVTYKLENRGNYS
jgi:quercetin dioxygenase-like cupin family protein